MNFMEHAVAQDKGFLFVGNSTALDFVNTIAMDGGETLDLCASWDDFVEWAQQAGLVSAPEAADLRRVPEQGRELEHAHRLRAELRALCENLAAERRVPETAVAAINAWLGVGGPGEKLAIRDGGVVREAVRPPVSTAHVLAAIARSAADLVTSVDPARVRRCASASCPVWFRDVSKNGARRWCSMDACGNRTKAAAFYRRRKDKGPPDARRHLDGSDQTAA